MKSKQEKKNVNHPVDEDIIFETNEKQNPENGFLMPIQCVWQIIYYAGKLYGNDPENYSDMEAFCKFMVKKITGDKWTPDTRHFKRMFILTAAEAKAKHIGKICYKKYVNKAFLKDKLNETIPDHLTEDDFRELMLKPVAYAEANLESAKNNNSEARAKKNDIDSIDTAEKNLTVVKHYFSSETIMFFTSLLL